VITNRSSKLFPRLVCVFHHRLSRFVSNNEVKFIITENLHNLF